MQEKQWCNTDEYMQMQQRICVTEMLKLYLGDDVLNIKLH